MPDTKITALTAITTVDPAADVLPIVDVSDTSMAASGTTKKITSNQILGAGGTATLASATITGDLTVDTSTLKVDSANNRVGIGTASPLGPFHLVTTAAGFSEAGYFENSQAVGANVGPRVSLLGAGSVAMSLIQSGWNAAANTDAYLAFLTRGSGGVTERYRIASDGVATWSNVGGVAGAAMILNANGLGVGASPSFKFHVQQTLAGTASAVNPLAYIVNNGSGNTAKLTLSDAVTTDGNITLTGSATAANRLLGFGINGVQQMVLDGNGNLGIGVQPSAAVAGNRKIEIGGSTNAGLTLSSSSANASARNWSTLCNFNAFGDLCFNQSNAQGGDPIAAGTTRMTLDASGRLLVGPTSANASGGVLQLSSGITFPATQVASSDANTLDDYEEGTFTPAITGSTTAGTATYVGRSGKYTKIGNLVQVQIFIDYNSHTGTGDTRITGLPFTNAGNFSAATVGYANGLALTAGNYVQAYVDASQSFILLNQAPTGGGSNTTVPIDPAATLVITATYTV